MKAKTNTPLLAALLLLGLMVFGSIASPLQPSGSIGRLTRSGSNSPLYPCLSDDGRTVLYVLEINDNGTTAKSIRVLDTLTGEDRELFRDGDRNAPSPHEKSALFVGTKPPQLSGSGRIAAFSLTLSGPPEIHDHYLAVVRTDGTDFQIYSFPIQALKGHDLKSLDISSPNWERLANYALDSEGNRVVCVVKGNLGPSRYGNPSGIITLDLATKEQRTLLAPIFEKDLWDWPSPPKNPLTGGGWGFGFSGNGETVFFGAQSSDEKTDYDLYSLDWNGGTPEKLTDFSDRWFCLGAIDRGGENVIFTYTGQKEQGEGTYHLNRKSGVPVFLTSSFSGQGIEFYASSSDGQFIVYKLTYTGIIRHLATGKEHIAFDENTPGYVQSVTPMDFPRLPSFWCPRIMSAAGDRILLIGFPAGKTTPELYMLQLNFEEP